MLESIFIIIYLFLLGGMIWRISTNGESIFDQVMVLFFAQLILGGTCFGTYILVKILVLYIQTGQIFSLVLN